MSTTPGKMKTLTIIKKNGDVVIEVLERGQHLCQSVYAAASEIGEIVSDEEFPEGDCPPVHETGHVGTE